MIRGQAVPWPAFYSQYPCTKLMCCSVHAWILYPDFRNWPDACFVWVEGIYVGIYLTELHCPANIFFSFSAIFWIRYQPVVTCRYILASKWMISSEPIIACHTDVPVPWYLKFFPPSMKLSFLHWHVLFMNSILWGVPTLCAHILGSAWWKCEEFIPISPGVYVCQHAGR